MYTPRNRRYSKPTVWTNIGKVKNLPKISVIIPTRNSGWILSVCLKGILSVDYPRSKVEIIIIDNESSDNTIKFSKKYGAKTYILPGKPPLVCQQRNLGAKKATGEYLLFLDHDMEISKGLLSDFAKRVEKEGTKYDAWYIPEKIITGSKLLTALRNFERPFYNATSIDAVRIIRKSKFFGTEKQYDPQLSGGPADWDLDIQLRQIGCQFDSISEPLYHHEERMNLFVYILKKGNWIEGIETYKQKWTKKYKGKFKPVIDEQFGLKYRIFTVFFEKGKWKKLLGRPDLYLGVLCIKLAMLLLATIKFKK
ncbi:MAG: hypothetical protein A3I38_02300 [Candidatus Wildermuthbacteria bacterium RIFCSPLOWO2_02_FULL_47_10]|uniref:Glycosyltransferase 2-like domain-containing protein n=1 Tax=Candidatus Wildermuthbacteria bacterium RIFCSPHIGHO2_02_FULL_47_17 TaxID=1802452 RepID=A0A1G2R8S9_9BACT|nr:MAG: hypothetical protein A3D59_01140 [Candidatus Wildermuthbacteria bacterium RIFCSPHIGHO2_02_FULL_47_17]OHA75694.1 MAG: hypothetical protein A3I38_02300 [Candidatus Wildermuthbacteria bacterium RIFCSPLOWO2_02_FULL_47_10]